MYSTIKSLGVRLKTNRLNLLLAVAGISPLLWIYLTTLWNRPTYQFFPLALFGAGLLAWREVKRMRPPASVGGVGVGWLLALVAGLAFLAANFLWSPWLGFVSVLLGLVAAIWWVGGWPLVRLLTPACLMLLAILHPPLGWDQTLTLWLRSVAVSNSSALLDWLQINHVQEGNTLLLPGKPLLVEEACSGINSLFLCNALCLFWVLWQRRSLFWLPLFLLATSLFVVLGNVFRITAGAAGFYYWQINLLSGWQHETFGLVLILVYSGLILSLDQLLSFLTQPIRPSASVPAEDSSPPPPSPRAPGFRTGMAFRVAGVFLALVGLGFFAAHLVANRGQKNNSFAHLNRQEIKLTLPARLAGWQRLNSDAGDQALVQTLGVHSLVWRFQREGMEAVVAADYPLDGFHNVKVCYTVNGWQISGEEELLGGPANEDLHVIKLTLKQSVHHAVVYHSVIDGNGNWLAPAKGMAGRFSQTAPAAIQTGYRVQLIEGGYTPLTGPAARAAEDLFFQARQLLVPQIIGQLRPPPAK